MLPIAHATIEIIPAMAPDGAIDVPWLEGGGEPGAGAPTFELKEAELAARGWIAITGEALLLRVEVEDPQHHNPFSRWETWKGDCLQIGIDARGDGSRGADPETDGLFGPDDMALVIALPKNGPEGWIFFTEAAGRRGAMPSEWLTAARDEATGTTHYRLSVPWAALGTPVGAFPALGMAVQVNDSAPGAAEQKRHYWGRGADGSPRPGLYHSLRIGTPPGHVAAAAPVSDTAWGRAQPAEAAVGIRADAVVLIEAAVGEAKVFREVPAGAGMSHFKVRVTDASGTGAPPLLELAVRKPGQVTALIDVAYPLKDPADVYRRLIDVLDATLDRSPHPVFTHHVRSVKAMAAQEWARMGLYVENNPTEADAMLAGMESLREAFEGECGEWEAYLDGRRSLLFAYLSPTDGTLQSYAFCLPKDWQPDRAYPLFFELHGAGNPNPMAGISNRLGNNPQAMDLRGYSAPKTFAEIQRNGYWIHPHGRGNLGYRGIGETDIWEAYADAAREFSFDPDRHYLYGFSMGGGGTWSIALRTPDRWAAIAIMAGGTWREDSSIPIAQNINQLPVFLWCGESDALFPHYLSMKRQLEEHNAVLRAETTPGLGHNYTPEIQQTALNWLQQHTRQRPAKFRFIADTPEHDGAWGIRLKREPLLSGAPAFECAIEDNVIHLRTSGTSAAKIDTGPSGLAMEGDYSVIWNGQPVYSGNAPLLLLKNAAAVPFEPKPLGRWEKEAW